MQQLDAKALFQKYQAGQCSPEELAVVENWLTFGEAGKLNLTEQELDEDLLELRQRAARVTRGRIVIWPRVIGAAAAVAAIVFGIWFYEVASSRKAPRNDVVVNDIAPGRNGATITLANGKVIQLSDAKSGVVVGGEEGLVYNDGTEVGLLRSSREALGSSRNASRNDDQPNPSSLRGGTTKQSPLEMTASTAKGQTYQFTLPDGTRVWLNADSKLSFPSQFIGKERKILLDGEGYFEVAKNMAKPFIVQTDKQEVTVLGTHFNINSYANEGSTKTTLLEGSVRISRHPDDRSDLLNSTDKRSLPAVRDDVVLKPNQQSIIAGNKPISITNVDVNEAVAWKNNKFVFDETDIRYIMRMVARWYNVEVIYTGTIPDEKFWGSVSRYENVSEVLKSLEQTGKIKFKIEGRRIYVSP
ncbi:FecR family protein [Pedobacter ginsengisoli]|uniref:FecR family protein n=1 Tax=Pedobacter ginsengisoli TaxID=363852 RepID=UPI00254BFCC0|nr:FecR family protein [Pedobacter ginsengisoli]